MPQRNGQNPIRKANTFEPKNNKFNEGLTIQNRISTGGGICQSCKTEVPSKPGFRLSALKCPKCGMSIGKNK